MTLAQFIEVVRRRHRAESDTNWSDVEIYQILTGRCNEVLSIIGLLEATDVLTSTAIGTQGYNLPSDTVRLKTLLYDGQALQEISFRDWELQKSGGITPSGKPIQYVIWNRQVLLIPIPDSVKILTFYYEKEHAYIDNSAQTTIDIPSVLHWRLADGVIADMYAKDLNGAMYDRHQTVWLNVHIPAFQDYAVRSKRGGRSRTIVDVDSHPQTDVGTY